MSYHGTLKQPCIKYKATFQHSELEKERLMQTYADGSTKKKYCPTFSGAEGIEALLFVEERFNMICRQLTFDTGAELYCGREMGKHCHSLQS